MLLEGAKQPYVYMYSIKLIAVYNKSHELIVHTMHGMFFISEKCGQRPKGILQEKAEN